MLLSPGRASHAAIRKAFAYRAKREFNRTIIPDRYVDRFGNNDEFECHRSIEERNLALSDPR
jgi:hypothetical protein